MEQNGNLVSYCLKQNEFVGGHISHNRTYLGGHTYVGGHIGRDLYAHSSGNFKIF